MPDVHEIENLYLQGKISRREFIGRMTALGAAVMIPSFFTSRPANAAVNNGGHFIQALTGGSTATTLDPGTISAAWEANINWQIRNNLVEIDHDFNPVPELAESWEPSADAKTWAFNLRKGVVFHNGKTMDSDDVLYSMNYHRGESSKSAVKSMLKLIENIQTDGKNRIIFTLKDGYADLPFVLSDFHLVVFPKETQVKDFNSGIGTGPYILEAYEPGVRSLAKRNPNYWKDGRGHFDSVETLSIADVNARTNALKTSQIHHMDRCERKTLHLLKRSKDLDILDVTGTFQYTMPMMTDLKPYDNNDVRMALKLSIDREDLVKRVLKGYGQVGNDHPVAPANRFYSKNIEQRKYDPDKARYHIKKAGMADHIFNLHTSEAAFSGADGVAEIFQEQAKKAGIKINIVREPNDGYWSNVWLKKEFCMSYWTGRPTADMIFSLVYSENAPWNESHWKNKRFNELLVQARAELENKKRASMYEEMQRICRDDGGSIIPVFPKIVEANSKKIAHGPISGFAENDGHRNTERWWFV